MDDAIEVKEVSDGGWYVSVAIADVSRKVTPGSDLDKDARERGHTYYFGTGNSPMLPRDLSEWKFSLWPKKERRAVVVHMKLTKDLGLASTALTLETIVSEEKLAYKQIPEILETFDRDVKDLFLPTVPSHIARARKLALGLLAKRRAAGALVFYDLNNGWVSTEEGAVKKLKDHTETIGYIIIQELMVLTNTAIARYAVEKSIPLLFRNHQTKAESVNRDEILKLIGDGMTAPIVDLEAFQRRTHMFFERAVYGMEPLGHFGLNEPSYTHFTSPIRRYADLVIHQQLRAHLKGQPLPHTAAGLAEIAVYLNDLAEKDREQESAHFKGMHERRAQRHIEERKLDGLVPKEFERVVKVETRSGSEPSEALVEAWQRRLNDGSVPSVCMTVLFMHGTVVENEAFQRAEIPEEWNLLKALTLDYLAEHTPDAVTILTQAASLGWPNVALEAAQPVPNVPNFLGQATMTVGGLLAFQALAVPGKTAKEARQRAAVTLLAAISGLEAPVFKEAPAPPPPPPKPVPVQEGKNPISMLMEHAQGTRSAAPSFDFKMAGEAHKPVVSCTARYRGNTVTVVSASKQEAKALAAKALLEKL